MEKVYPDLKYDPVDNNWYMHKITKYFLSNEDGKIKKVGRMLLKDSGVAVYDNRLFSFHSSDVNIYDVSDGWLIESFWTNLEKNSNKLFDCN